MRIFLAIPLLALALPVLAQKQQDIRVLDGDTVEVPIKNVAGHPKRVSVRLKGINAAETGTRAACDAERAAGEAAKVYVRDRLTQAKRIKVQFISRDKYGGRVVGMVTLDGKDLAQDMVKGGYAVAYSGGKRVNAWCK